MRFAPRSLFIGGDYASTRNTAASVICTLSDKGIYTIRGIKVTYPPPKGSGRKYIDLEAEHRDPIEELWKKGLVGGIAVDRTGVYSWLSRWEKMGLPIHSIDTGSIVMSKVTEHFLDVVKNKRLRHNGDPVLRTHIGNSRLKDTASGGTMISKGMRGSLDNDCAIATLLAIFIAEQEAFRPAKVTQMLGNPFYEGEGGAYALTKDRRGQYTDDGIWLMDRGHTVSHVGKIRGEQAERHPKKHRYSTCAGRRYGTCEICNTFIDEMRRNMDLEQEEKFVNDVRQGAYDNYE